MRRIPISELQTGQRYSKALYVDNTNVLVGAGVTIKAQDLQRLTKMNIQFVETAGELLPDNNIANLFNNTENILKSYESLRNAKAEFVTLHQKALGELVEVFQKVKSEQRFDERILRDIIDQFIDFVETYPNIFIFLPPVDTLGQNYLTPNSVNVAVYSLVIGQALEYNRQKLSDLGVAGLLFDVGMLKIPAYILEKKEGLSEDEKKLIYTHPVHGYRLLTKMSAIKPIIANAAMMHHEQYDGKGYPRKLKGSEIPEFVRIISIADCYQSIRRTKNYGKKKTAYQAMRELLSTSMNRFDPLILQKFLNRLSIYPVGSLVKLNDNSIAIVLGSMPDKPLRPVLKIIQDDKGNRIDGVQIINLLEDTSRYITTDVDETAVQLTVADEF